MERTDAAIKFLLLNSAVHFQEIVEKARSVVLAGGTMQPVRVERARLWSCIWPLQLVGCRWTHASNTLIVTWCFDSRSLK